MIKTKIGDIFIKDKNFSDPNYIELQNTFQILDFNDYYELSKLETYVNYSETILSASASAVNLLYNDFKNAKAIDINNSLEYFLILPNNLKSGTLYKRNIDNLYQLCLENISFNGSFDSYLAVYDKTNLIIAHTDPSLNAVYLQKITQNNLGEYEVLNFSTIPGNFKVVSMNKYRNIQDNSINSQIIFLTLSDNTTTYFYKIEDYVVTLINTVTENIVLQDQKVVRMNEWGLCNSFDNSLPLKNSEFNLNYEFTNNSYFSFPVIDFGIEYSDFNQSAYTRRIGGDLQDDYLEVLRATLLSINGNDIYVQYNLNDPMNNITTTKIHTLDNYQSDLRLVLLSYNTLLIIYKATDNETKFYIAYDIYNKIVNFINITFDLLLSSTVAVDKISSVRHFENIYLYITDFSNNVYNIILTLDTEASITQLIVEEDLQEKTNHSYFLKAK